MGDELAEARTALDVQIAEGRTSVWLYGATPVAVLCSFIPGFPAVLAVMIPSVVVSVRASVKSWRRLRENKRRRAAEGKAP